MAQKVAVRAMVEGALPKLVKCPDGPRRVLVHVAPETVPIMR